MVHLKMFAQPKLKYVFYIFFISFIGIITTEASEFPYFCDLKISYYPGEDGQAYEVFHREPNKIRAKTKIFHGEHPSHGSFKQLGVELRGDVCYRNESTGQLYTENPDDLSNYYSDIEVKKHKYSLSKFILVFLDDDKSNEENDECSDKWWTSFKENHRVIIKVADIWQGMTAHYSTDYAIAPEDIMLNGKWICS